LSSYVSIRSRYVSIAYVSIRQHTSAYVVEKEEVKERKRRKGRKRRKERGAAIVHICMLTYADVY
jgi:hypothetical protein